jgi:DNA-binding transcriptional LysR family regulator
VTGRIDVGLVRPPIGRPDFNTRPVLSEALVAALPRGDPRLSKAKLALSDFDGTPLIMYSMEGAGYFHQMLVGLFDQAGVAPVYVQHVTQIHSMLALVQAGLGAALVPEAALALHFDDVQCRPLQTGPARPAQLHMAWRKDNDNPPLQSFLDLCATEIEPEPV